MNTSALKKSIVQGVVAGVVFTAVLYGFDTFTKTEVSPYRYVFLGLFFGICMGGFGYKGFLKREETDED